MTSTNTAGAEFTAMHGISHIVRARETQLSDVATTWKVAAEHGIGIEIFVHGALYYSEGYLMAESTGGKSQIMNWEKPNNRGVYTGYVSSTDKKRGKVVVKIAGTGPILVTVWSSNLL